MRSVVLYTEEIDDLNEAAEDLFAQTEGFEIARNSIAVLYTEEDTDYPELYRLLSEKWKFPIIGCTAMAMLTGRDGYCSMGISVMILTSDTCEFSVGITGSLDADNYKELIDAEYKRVKSDLSSDPKLILSYAGMVTDEKGVPGDDLVNALNAAGGGIPVYGATASDGFSFSGFRVFCNDVQIRDGLVMALIAGDINPKMICVNSIENKASFSYVITESKSNLVYRLGNGTFLETLKKEGMEADKTEVLGDYILSPFMVTVDQGGGDSVEVARNLSVLNHETGTGSFLGVMPEGSILSIGLLNRSDVQASVDKAFDEIFKELESPQNTYHTLLCTSCVARFLALASNTAAEAETYKDRLPDGVQLMGLYAYGEYCPVRSDKSGREYNMFHNFTFTILAI